MELTVSIYSKQFFGYGKECQNYLQTSKKNITKRQKMIELHRTKLACVKYLYSNFRWDYSEVFSFEFAFFSVDPLHINYSYPPLIAAIDLDYLK